MEITVAEQTYAFLFSLLTGAALGVFYDVFRVLRIAIRPGKAAIVIQDAIFFVVCGAVTFVFMLTENYGQIRIFLILGELMGFMLYYFTIGALVIKCAHAVIHFFCLVFAFIYKATVLPFRSFGRFLIKKTGPIRSKIVKNTKKAGKNAKLSLKHGGDVLYNLVKKHPKPKQKKERGREKKSREKRKAKKK